MYMLNKRVNNMMHKVTWAKYNDLDATFDADVSGTDRHDALRNFLGDADDVIVAINGCKVGPTTFFQAFRPKWKAAIKLGRDDENIDRISDRVDELTTLALGNHSADSVIDVADAAWSWVQR